MDFDIPKDIQDYLDELDRFIDDKIKPLQAQDDNAFQVVTFDGQEPIDLGDGDVVTVEDAHTPLRLVAVSGRS